MSTLWQSTCALWHRFIAYAFGPYTYEDEGAKP